MDKFLKNVADNEVEVAYATIECKMRTRITLSNHAEIQKKRAIGYIYVQHCDMFWTDIMVYADTFDLRVVLLQEWNDRFHEERAVFETNAVNNATTNRQYVPKQLENVGSVVVFNSPIGRIPAVFTDFVWPKMAEVQFNNISMQVIPSNNLQETMPFFYIINKLSRYLQSSC